MTAAGTPKRAASAARLAPVCTSWSMTTLDMVSAASGWAHKGAAAHAVGESAKMQRAITSTTRMCTVAIEPLRCECPAEWHAAALPAAGKPASGPDAVTAGPRLIMSAMDAGALTIIKALQPEGEKLARKGWGARVCEESRR